MLCTDFKGSDRTYLNINYQMKSGENTLQKPIDLSCDVAYLSEIDNTKKPYVMGLTVYPNAKLVVNSATRERIAGVNKINDETIDVSQQDKYSELDYIINRVTGKLVGAMFINGSRTGLVGGQCQAVDLSVKKF